MDIVLEWWLELLVGSVAWTSFERPSFLINSFWDGRLDSFRAVAWASSGVGCWNFFLGWFLELLFGLVAWTSFGRPSFFNQLRLGWALGLFSGGCLGLFWGWLFELLLGLGCLSFFFGLVAWTTFGRPSFLVNSFWVGRLGSFRAVA